MRGIHQLQDNCSKAMRRHPAAGEATMKISSSQRAMSMGDSEAIEMINHLCPPQIRGKATSESLGAVATTEQEREDK
jgi:hypothetical protein